MPDTIETFINKLQADGVQAGQAEAQKIRDQADRQAKQLIQEAQEQAKNIIHLAEAEAQKIHNKTKTELELAARDTILRLQDTLNRALQAVLATGVTDKFNDTEFLGGLLHDIVMQYAQADIKGSGTITINVSEEMQYKLTHWAIEILHKDITSSQTNVDLHGTLTETGFQYQVSDGTVEVTVESVVEFLSRLVGPHLQKIVAEATGKITKTNNDR